MGSGQEGLDIWSVSRCKRVVRPFLAKVHSANDMVIKNPSVLQVQMDTGELIAQLIKPRNALHRLESLKPLVSPELYQVYCELFQVFKQILTSIQLNQKKRDLTARPALTTRPTLLTAISLYEIGKAMMLSTRTTYYKLNQAALFDASTLPPNLKKYNNTLSVDIDEWLELEMAGSMIHNYRLDILLGYILHLVVFNIHVLYLLVPVLIHWLYEELVLTQSVFFKQVLNKLFTEFWYFNNDKYYENINSEVLSELTGFSHSAETINTLFWWLYNIQYWDKFISSIGFRSCQEQYSQEQSPDSYETLVLDTLMINEKLLSTDHASSIYRLLQRNPHHLQVNNILITLLTNLIEKAANLKLFDGIFTDFKMLLRVWISFSSKFPMVFNSLLPKNHELFEGIILFNKYLTKKLNQNNDLTLTLILLKHFFLDEPVTSAFIKTIDQEGFVKELIGLQQPHVQQSLPLRYSNYEINDFIYWLLGNDLNELGLEVFLEFYGDFKRYLDPELTELDRLLS